MIIKKTYHDGSYLVIEVTDIEFHRAKCITNLIGKLIDEDGCEEFRQYKELCITMDENVKVVK